MTRDITMTRARLALAVLHSPLRFLLEPDIAELTYAGRRTSREIRLPVMFVRDGNEVTVLAGHAHRKSWWRNFRQPWPIEVTIGGHTRNGIATVVKAGTLAFRHALVTYRQRFPHAHFRPGDQLVVITLDDISAAGGR